MAIWSKRFIPYIILPLLPLLFFAPFTTLASCLASLRISDQYRKIPLGISNQARLQTSPRNRYVFPSAQTKIIDQMSWVYVRNAVIDPGGLGPCISIVLYHRGKRAAFAGHYHSIGSSSLREVRDFLSRAIKRLPKSEVEVYLAGGADFSEAGDVSKDRKATLQILQEYGIRPSQIHVTWTPVGHGAEFTLDTKTGDVLLDFFEAE